MSRAIRVNNIDRIIDANINRAREGLRVCEEVCRFLLNNRNLTRRFKKARHEIYAVFRLLPGSADILQERRSRHDVGSNIHADELNRSGYQDIFFANIQRAKESVRVLEEFAKLKDINVAIEFKKIRYECYEIEKKTAEKIASLRNLR